MKLLAAILTIISTSVFSISAYASADKAPDAVDALSQVYGASCSSDQKDAIVSDLSSKLDFRLQLDNIWKKNGCENAPQSLQCVSAIDSLMGKFVRKEMTDKGCDLPKAWAVRLAAITCKVSRDSDQLKTDVDSYDKNVAARGYCTFRASSCSDSSVKDLTIYSFNCKAQDGLCISDVKLCESYDPKAVVKPGIRVFGVGTEDRVIDPNASEGSL